MSTGTISRPQSERASLQRLWWVGLLALVGSVVVNVLLRQFAVANFDISPDFNPLMTNQYIVFTAVGVVGAVVVFWLLPRFTARPRHVFKIIAIVVLLLSMLPDVLLYVIQPVPGITLAGIVTLMLMHVTTALVTVGLLLALGHAPQEMRV